MFGHTYLDCVYGCLISECVTTIGLVGLLVSLPFYLLAVTLLSVGRMRTERVPGNVFHRAFDFCESTGLGRLAGGAALFSPTIIILISSAILCPADILDGVAVATLPWLVFSIGSLLELRYYRKI